MKRKLKCHDCGRERDASDMGRISGDAYCHGAWDQGNTCYMRATWTDLLHFGNLIGACASVGIEHGKTTAEVLSLFKESGH